MKSGKKRKSGNKRKLWTPERLETMWLLDEGCYDRPRVLVTQAIAKNTVVCERHVQEEVALHWLPRGEGPLKLFDAMRQTTGGNCSKHYQEELALWVTNRAVGVGEELTKCAATDTCVYAEEKSWVRLKQRLDLHIQMLAEDTRQVFKLVRKIGEEVRLVMAAHKVREHRVAAGEFDDVAPTFVVHGIECKCGKAGVEVGNNCAKVLYARASRSFRNGQDVFVVDLPTAKSTTAVPVRGVVESQDLDDLAVYINFSCSGTFKYHICTIDLNREDAVLRAQQSQAYKAINAEDPIVNFWFDGALAMKPFMERRAQIDQAAAAQRRADSIKAKASVFNTIMDAPFICYYTDDEVDEEDQHELQ